MRLRQLLDIVEASEERVAMGLAGTDPQRVQDHLCILRIVFVPAVVQLLARASQLRQGITDQLDDLSRDRLRGERDREQGFISEFVLHLPVDTAPPPVTLAPQGLLMIGPPSGATAILV